MKHIEYVGRAPFCRTGLSPTLRAFLHLRGDRARSSRRTRLTVALLLAAAAFLVLAAAPAAAKEIHAFSTSFGSPGHGDGQFEFNLDEFPRGIAVDNSASPSKGDVYVADVGNHRVEKFGPSGEFLLAFGADVGGPGVDICTTGCVAGTPGSTPGAFEKPRFIAVDNSIAGGGDVYVAGIYKNSRRVISKFNEKGELITGWGDGGQLIENDVEGIAVDATGTLYVLDLRTIVKYTSSGAAAGSLSTDFRFFNSFGIAVDSSGNIYSSPQENGSNVAKSGPTGETLNKEVESCPTNLGCAITGLGVDSSNDDLYVANTLAAYNGQPAGVYRFGSSGALLESSIGFGEGLASISAVAVRASNHAIYAIDSKASHVAVFTLQEVEPPSAAIKLPSEISFTTAHVSGVVNPKGHFVTSCRFEYVTEAHFLTEGFAERSFQAGEKGQKERQKAEEEGYEPPRQKPCATNPGRGSGDVAVEAKLTTLKPSTAYHVRLVAENHAGAAVAEEPSPFETNGPVAKPVVTIEPPSSVTGASAHFSGHVNPNAPGPAPQDEAFDTTWHFECTPECRGLQDERFPAQGEVKADDSSHGVSGDSALQPGTPYEVTLVAENAGGKTIATAVFTTPAIAPTIDSTFPTAVSGTAATLNAEVKLGGAPTTFHFEYVTQEQFEKSEFVEAETTPESAITAVNEVQSLNVSATRGQLKLKFGGESTADIAFNEPAPAIQAKLRSLSSIGPEGVSVSGGPGDAGGTRPYVITFEGPLGGRNVVQITVTEGTAPLGGGSGASVTITTPGRPATSNEDHTVSTTITGLTPEANYRFRVVAHNSVEAVDGPARPLYTYVTPTFASCSNQLLREEDNSLALPDCRAYEAVSPLDAPDDAYVPNGPYGNEGIGGSISDEPFQASASGDAVTYGGDPLASGGTGTRGNGRGNELLGGRSPGGWQVESIQLSAQGEDPHEAQQTRYQAYLFPLSLGIFGAISQPLAASAQPQAPPSCGQRNTSALYTRTADSSHHALFAETQSPVGGCGYPRFVAAADGSQFFFQTEAALIPGVVEDPKSGGDEFPCPLNCNLYDSAAGSLNSVNLLPGGIPAPHATFGSPPLEEGKEHEEGPDLSRAVSTDGSHAYWTDEETGVLYLRRNPSSSTENCAVAASACTVQVSAGAKPARFWTATPDGRYAYYTEAAALWRFDAEAGAGHEREELVPAAAEVQGVLGVNEVGEDGAYLYFVAGGGLPGTGAKALTCKAAEGPERYEEEKGKLPPSRGCNLYLLHAGEAKLLATLSPRDNNQLEVGFGNGTSLVGGDWRPNLGRRTAQTTPDGHSLVFQSTLPLTGYDNSAFVAAGENTDALIEAFVYDADTGRLSCASCSPAGEPPLVFHGGGSPRVSPRTYLPVSNAATYMPRWLSADGSRVFFDTSQPLLPVDHNRQFDVYEWERRGAGTCQKGSALNGSGCVSLLSSGREGSSPIDSNSLFIDASADGSHVFFLSRPPMVPGATETMKLYDAHEKGGFPASHEAAPCETEACKGPIPPPPPTTSPGTFTFSSPGNEKPKQQRKKHHKKPRKKGHKKHGRAGASHGGHR